MRSSLTEHQLPSDRRCIPERKSGSKHVFKASAQIDLPRNQFTGNSVPFRVFLHSLPVSQKIVELKKMKHKLKFKNKLRVPLEDLIYKPYDAKEMKKKKEKKRKGHCHLKSLKKDFKL